MSSSRARDRGRTSHTRQQSPTSLPVLGMENGSSLRLFFAFEPEGTSDRTPADANSRVKELVYCLRSLQLLSRELLLAEARNYDGILVDEE